MYMYTTLIGVAIAIVWHYVHSKITTLVIVWTVSTYASHICNINWGWHEGKLNNNDDIIAMASYVEHYSVCESAGSFIR